ncbi:MAG: methyltransferase [Nocardioides sp.]
MSAGMPTRSLGESVSERRTGIRTGVVWAGLHQALRPGSQVIDIGGGTGGFAVRLAEEGHRVLVVEPSPDALAALGRRAAERGVAKAITAVQGDFGDLHRLAADVGGADLVLCHGVLEMVADPSAALGTVKGALRPGGMLSLLVAQRHAAVIARAMAGHFQQALDLLAPQEPAEPSGRTGRRFTLDELTALLGEVGLAVETVHAVRVFTDLVPGSLLDSEAGATQALAELEQAVCERPEYLALAAQLHLLARA